MNVYLSLYLSSFVQFVVLLVHLKCKLGNMVLFICCMRSTHYLLYVCGFDPSTLLYKNDFCIINNMSIKIRKKLAVVVLCEIFSRNPCYLLNRLNDKLLPGIMTCNVRNQLRLLYFLLTNELLCYLLKHHFTQTYPPGPHVHCSLYNNQWDLDFHFLDFNCLNRLLCVTDTHTHIKSHKLICSLSLYQSYPPTLHLFIFRFAHPPFSFMSSVFTSSPTSTTVLLGFTP